MELLTAIWELITIPIVAIGLTLKILSAKSKR